MTEFEQLRDTFNRLGVEYQILGDDYARAEAAQDGHEDWQNMADWASVLGVPEGLVESREGYRVVRVEVGGSCPWEMLFDPDGFYLGGGTEGPFVPAEKGAPATN